MGEEGGGVPVSVLLGRDYIDYRGSKLTRILQNSLNGNTKTVIICTVPQTSLEETLSTFQFASTAKNMENLKRDR
ncbi:kinesin-like protein klp-20 isoform X2 [Podarcis raffonei]|uniref:kinesin-like protein klp-20 isoform X2 n=1 Tax=Podarcis raffonei TaxID=65483 RepID=UPI0023294863|nr:kinesin-like protein klp-20 isoform X2 [Podarcis raffonei]